MSQIPKRLLKLTVIEGGGKTTPIWRRFPQEILAPSPFNREKTAILRFAHHDISKAWANHRYQPVLDGWGLVVGTLPHLPNISKIKQELDGLTLLGLKDAHACFRGVKRPVADDSTGFDTLVYITKPNKMLAHEPSMACIAKLVEVPPDVVFVIYARLDHPGEGRYGSPYANDQPVRGVLTNWHFVECDPKDHSRPVGYKDRYRKQLW